MTRMAFLICLFLVSPLLNAALPGDEMLDRYFHKETRKVASRSLSEITSVEDWRAKRETYRHQLADMLGLASMRPRTELKPVITGTIDAGSYVVEKLHFQSMPGLYVTANLYRPKTIERPLPAILYVCGHAIVKKDGISFGNKAGYQHHGAWFARNGYVCLIPDTLQLGEIEGIHHGLYREKMWWWLARGYTSAGVEAWNGIRCLDYLQSRPEVDGEKIGMTGRSGGGAYSWWTAALDDRVKVAVPVAGITDLENHVIDDVIEGHCDCMYMVNTFRWDYPQVAALVAPRPLLIANSDKDTIFPLSGVYRTHQEVSRIYKLLGAPQNLGLLITEGPHKDTQDLQVPTFRWMNRFLKGEEGPLADATADKPFTPEQLKVFPGKEYPPDQINTKIHEQFVPMASEPMVPGSQDEWAKQRDAWMKGLKEKSFAGWPAGQSGVELKEISRRTWDGVHFRIYEFISEPEVTLRLYIAAPATDMEARVEGISLHVLDELTWPKWLAVMSDSFPEHLAAENIIAAALEPSGQPPRTAAQAPRPAPRQHGIAPMATPDLAAIRSGNRAHIWLAPRGVGLTAWTATDRQHTHILRRFYLLGQTLEGQQVYDVRRALQAIRSEPRAAGLPIDLQSQGEAATVALYASLFEPELRSVSLYELPASHRQGPQFLNVLRLLDVPAAVAMGAERTNVTLHVPSKQAWEYPLKVSEAMKWPGRRLEVKPLTGTAAKPGE